MLVQWVMSTSEAMAVLCQRRVRQLRIGDMDDFDILIFRKKKSYLFDHEHRGDLFQFVRQVAKRGKINDLPKECLPCMKIEHVDQIYMMWLSHFAFLGGVLSVDTARILLLINDQESITFGATVIVSGPY